MIMRLHLKTDEAVSRIERKHTHSNPFRVTTNYKSAFIELGFEMADMEESNLKAAHKSIKFAGWTIQFDPPPIPIRSQDWQYFHEDYDGAPDSGDTRCGACASMEECLSEILELHISPSP